MKVDRAKVEEAVRLFLQAIGEDITREGLIETPSRVASMAVELFGKTQNKNEDELFKNFELSFGGFVVVKNISFCSFCEHHLMPFFGNVHVAYLPGNSVFGLSKFARIVDFCSGRLQLQERLTHQIAKLVLEKSGAKGVMVAVDGFHSCMALRGVKKFSSRTVTFAADGVCKGEGAFLNEGNFLKFLGLI